MGPVEHALALWLGSWDVGDGPPVVGAVLLLAKQAAQRVVEVAVAVVGGGDAREHVAEEARGAEAADAVCVAHGGVSYEIAPFLDATGSDTERSPRTRVLAVIARR